MSKFYTEKEMEDFLEKESRVLTLPDGSTEHVNVMKLIWIQFDSMQKTDAWTNDELIEMAYNWYKREHKYDFTTYFWNLVAYAFSDVKRARYGM